MCIFVLGHKKYKQPASNYHIVASTEIDFYHKKYYIYVGNNAHEYLAKTTKQKSSSEGIQWFTDIISTNHCQS